MGAPTDSTLFGQQEFNRRRSRWLVFGFLLFFAWLGIGGDWLLYELTRVAPLTAYHHRLPVLGLALGGLAAALVAYERRSGADHLLWSTGAWRLLEPTTPDQQSLVNVVEEMSIAAGLPKPGIWIIEGADPNAFATSNDPDHAQIAATTGLVGAVALVADGFGRVLSRGVRLGSSGSHGGGTNRSTRNLGPLVLMVLVVWLVSWLLAPLVTRLLAVGVSRQREYLADAMSAQFTRNPLALATALETIERASAPTTSVKGGVAHLCIADPLGRAVNGYEGPLSYLLATHPPMALRVARLRAMGYQTKQEIGNVQPF